MKQHHPQSRPELLKASVSAKHHLPRDSEEYISALWVAAFNEIAARTTCCSQLNPVAASYFMGRGWLGSNGNSNLENEPDLSTPAAKRSSSAGNYVLRNMHVVNPGQPIQKADLWIHDGKITAMLPPCSPIPEGLEQLPECNGKWVMPGLIDMHVHLPSDNVLKLTPHFMQMFIAHGVTGVRETGDVDATALPAALRWNKLNPGLGPEIAYSKYFVGRAPFRWKNSLEYQCEADADQIVDRLLSEGASCMKLYENLHQADIRHLQQKAEDAGLVVLGHVPTRLRYEQASLSDTQHFFGVPDPASLRRDHVFSRTADWDSVDQNRLDQVVRHTEIHHLANTPTLTINKALLGYRDPEKLRTITQGRMPSFFSDVIWHPEKGLPVYRGLNTQDFDTLGRAFEKKKTLFRQLHEAGCILFAGTDTMQPFSIPGYTLHQELKNFVEAGMKPADALKSATLLSANRLGWKDRGLINESYKADMIILRENPCDDIKALDEIHTVFVRGIPVNKVQLQRNIESNLESREYTFNRLASKILATIAMQRAAKNFTA